MSNKNNYTAELKYHIVMEYIRGYVSVTDLCKAYEIAVSTFHDWKRRYEKYGLQGLEESKTFKEYSKELKESAVLDYLSGDYSLANVADKYELSGKTVLRNWIKRYNSHKELNTTGAKGDEVMTKRKNTSLKERIEIVKYCIQENKKTIIRLLKFMKFHTSKCISGLRNMNDQGKMDLKIVEVK